MARKAVRWVPAWSVATVGMLWAGWHGCVHWFAHSKDIGDSPGVKAAGAAAKRRVGQEAMHDQKVRAMWERGAMEKVVREPDGEAVQSKRL